MFKKYLLISVSSLSLSTSLFAMDSIEGSKKQSVKAQSHKKEKQGTEAKNKRKQYGEDSKTSQINNEFIARIQFPGKFLNNPDEYLKSFTDEKLKAMNLKVKKADITKLLENSHQCNDDLVYVKAEYKTPISLLAFYAYLSSVHESVDKWEKKVNGAGLLSTLSGLIMLTYDQFEKRSLISQNIKTDKDVGPVVLQVYLPFHLSIHKMIKDAKGFQNRFMDAMGPNLLMAFDWIYQSLDPLQKFMVSCYEINDDDCTYTFRVKRCISEISKLVTVLQNKHDQLKQFLDHIRHPKNDARESIMLKLTDIQQSINKVNMTINNPQYKKLADPNLLLFQAMDVVTRNNFFLGKEPFRLINSLAKDTLSVPLNEEELKALDELFYQFQMEKLQQKAGEGQEARKKEEESRKKEEEIRKKEENARKAEQDKINSIIFEQYDQKQKANNRRKGKGRPTQKDREKSPVSSGFSISLSIIEENAPSPISFTDNILEENLPQPNLPSSTAELTIESQKETISQIEDEQIDEETLEEKKLLIKQAIESILNLSEINQFFVTRKKLESYLYTLEYQEDIALLETIDSAIDELHCKILSQREPIKDTSEGRVMAPFIREYINNVMNISAKHLKFSGLEAKYIVEALGGECDNTRSGSRIAYKLRDAQGHEHVRSIHLHNITNILDGGRLSSFRDLLLNAGYY